MKKHIFKIIICMCIMMSLLSTVVLTASGSGSSDTSIIVGGVELNASAPYLANGARTASASQPTSGGYAFFDAANGRLTLHDAVIEDDAWPFRTSYGIYFAGDLSIVLEGTNTIKGDSIPGGHNSYGIYCEGDVTIAGSSATIESGIVNNPGISCGIYSEGDIKIISGSVMVKGESYAMNKAPITPDMYYTIKTYGTTTDTPNENFLPDKIGEYKTIRIAPTSVLIGGVSLTYNTPYLANGASTASASQPTSGGYAFYEVQTGTLTLHNASINGAVSGISNYGIYTLDNLTIALEGINSITAGDADCDSFMTTWRGDSEGIFVDNAALTISGTGSLTVRSGKGSSSCGIHASGVTIKDSAKVDAFAGCADGSWPGLSYNCGIYSKSKPCYISSNANVTAAGGEVESTYVDSIGIYASEGFQISNANVTATGKMQAMKCSIFSPAIIDGTITVAADELGNNIVGYNNNINDYKYIRIVPERPQAQWSVVGEHDSVPTAWFQGSFSQAKSYLDGLSSDAAYIQLLSDVNNDWLSVGEDKTVVLDLNGKTFDRGYSGQDAVEEGYVIAINGGTLTLKDSGNGGKITGGNSTAGCGGGVTVHWGGTFYMQGGIITGNYADYGGGVFVAQNSSDGRDNLFYMSGGSITGNNSKFDGGGVCISSNSVMKVSGGATIHNNFKNGTLSDGIYVQGSGEKNNVELDGKSITVCGALTGSIGIVEKDLYFPVNRDSIQIAVSDTSYSITQSDADKFSSDRSVYFTTYSNEDSNPVVLLRRPYIVTYDDNGATSGEVPTDTNLYYPGDTVTVAVNSGNLQKTCYTLVGWNTRADGTGVSYTSDHGTFNISSDTTLYAEWEEAIAVHEFEWIIDKDATATESGSKHEECKNCGYKKAAVEIPAIGLPAQPEDSAKPSDKETTQTGDNNSVSIYIVMILFAISGIASTIILGKKKCY